MARLPRVLTIAGSDPTAGAGIQADLKTFSCFNVVASSVVAVVTSQNTVGIQAVHPLPPELVALQIDSVVEDVGVDAVKIGMLYAKEIIDVVIEKIRQYSWSLVVLDPVLSSKTGHKLLADDAYDSLKELMKYAFVVTPNVREAELLSGLGGRSQEDMVKCAEEILKLGPRNVVITGGHYPSSGKVLDRLYTERREAVKLEDEKLESENTHGTGCVYSSALTCYLALGYDVVTAFKKAHFFTKSAILHGVRHGKNFGMVDPVGEVRLQAERYFVLSEVKQAVSEVLEKQHLFRSFCPEVGMNVAMSLERAKAPSDVCAVDGRIVKTGKGLKRVGDVEFGASKHLARLLLAYKQFNDKVNAVLNLAYSPDLVSAMQDLGLTCAFVDREKEPKEVAEVEGSSMSWVVKECYEKYGFLPAVIYDAGAKGKEAMVRLFAESATKAVLLAEKAVEKALSKKQ